MTPANALLPAIDPARSAVVEACAGSGKTWLLVSRMLRLLLAGAAPSELLAITFTRKAAAEMQARLDAWLTDLALLPDADALEFLAQRGITGQTAHDLLPTARGLLERVLAAPPLITTFHGWFFHLLARAPLSLRLPGEVLEDAALLREEAWFAFAEALGRTRGGAEETAFRELVGELSLSSVRGLLAALLARRAEWWAAGQGEANPVAAASEALAARLGVSEADDPTAALLEDPGFRCDLAEFQALLEANAGSGLSSDAARAARIASVIDAEASAALDALHGVLLTRDGTVRSCKLSEALSKRLGGAAQRYVDLHHGLAGRLLQTLDRLAEQRALRLNRLGLTAGQAYLNAYQRLKDERGGLDFSDAELEAARLLDDEEAAGAVLMKLDARWKHLLLDEFQDTTPLQWRILQAWLAAYGADGERPTVFLVGDPKQSIYRFRRAEPRLFATAADWLAENYQARRYPQNETRRCAPRVVAWVNALFGGRDDYPVFTAHSAHQSGLPGCCEIHLAEPGDALAPAAIRFRDPLAQAPATPAPKRLHEAAWVAARIAAIVGHLELADGAGGSRLADYRDITLLYAKRRDLDVFEAAFKRVGIPYVGDRRGGLLASLEAEDLVALLTVLVSPLDDLALAQSLKCPVFGCTDEDLEHLACGEGPWWLRLLAWSKAPAAPARIVRAAHLLAAWRQVAGPLPVHDLLDRVFHEGELRSRYAAAVAPHLRAGVLANLDGVLGLSLGLSGGRFPSLPRFLDELRQLRDKAGQDAPDEPPTSDANAVRMLTIHAAKGLEAAVVCLIKADEGDGRDEHYGVIMDWPPVARRPVHFSLHGPKAWRGAGRDDLFAQEAEQAARERLNLLYVAMTRARQALFISGVVAADKPPAHWLGLAQTALQQAAMAGLPMSCWRDAGTVAVLANPPVAAPGAGIPPIGQYRPPVGPEAEFGIAVHACLEWITEGLAEADAHARLGITADSPIAAAVRRILAIPELAAAFDPTRHLCARNEMEFLDGSGQSFRIDRLVEFADAVWVLDYKTGSLDEPDPACRALPYLAQLDGYREAARQLYPDKPVRTALVFTDGAVEWP